MRSYIASLFAFRSIISLMTDNSQHSNQISPSADVYKLAGFGIWAPFVWLGWIASLAASSFDSVPWQSIYLVICIAMMIFVFTHIKIKASITTSAWASGLDVVSSVIMASVALILGFCSPGLGPTVVVLAVCVGGFALAWSYLRWGMFYASINVRQAIVFVFVGGIIWSLFEILFSFISHAAAAVVVACVALLSSSFYRHAQASCATCEHYEFYFASERVVGMWKVWLVIFTVSLVTSTFIAFGTTFEHLSRTTFSLINAVCVITLSVLILIWALKTPFSFDFALFWRVTMFVIAGGLVLAALVPSNTGITLFFRMIPGILIPTVWLTVSDIARHSGKNSGIIIAFGISIYGLASFLGAAVYREFGLVASLSDICVVLLFILFVVGTTCLETRDPDIRRIFSGLNPQLIEFDQPQKRISFEQRCQQIGQSYALTQREIEIMMFVCRGRSRSFIAEELCLSENTVKSHVSHVYAKLGIHSKKDLQQLVGQDF